MPSPGEIGCEARGLDAHDALESVRQVLEGFRETESHGCSRPALAEPGVDSRLEGDGSQARDLADDDTGPATPPTRGKPNDAGLEPRTPSLRVMSTGLTSRIVEPGLRAKSSACHVSAILDPSPCSSISGTASVGRCRRRQTRRRRPLISSAVVLTDRPGQVGSIRCTVETRSMLRSNDAITPTPCSPLHSPRGRPRQSRYARNRYLECPQEQWHVDDGDRGTRSRRAPVPPRAVVRPRTTRARRRPRPRATRSGRSSSSAVARNALARRACAGGSPVR